MRKKRTLRICIIPRGFPRFEVGGFGTFFPSLARGLVKNGINVFVLGAHRPGVKKFKKFDRVKVYRFLYFFPFKLQKPCYSSGILTNIQGSLLAKLQLPFFFQLFSLIWLIKNENRSDNYSFNLNGGLA